MTTPTSAENAATIVLAHSLGLGVVAEGVETEAQRDYLARLGCDIVQGYLYSRPLPAADVEAFLRRAR
jgi:EAL domain-containing protein (putative c-di-GMP-specific phosphodiesterase class I)